LNGAVRKVTPELGFAHGVARVAPPTARQDGLFFALRGAFAFPYRRCLGASGPNDIGDVLSIPSPGAAAATTWWRAIATDANARGPSPSWRHWSDSELRDIGVHRSEIYWVVDHGSEGRPRRADDSFPRPHP
jgi:hypothetical protein